MTNSHSIESRETSRHQEITDSAITNIELFRQQGKAALGLYSKHERKIIAQLYKDVVDVYEFLDMLETQLIPLRATLNSKRTNETFKKALAKHTLQHPNEVQPAIDLVIDYSDNFHVDTFVRNNTSLTTFHTEWLKEFVATKTIEDVATLKKHYSDATLFKTVAMTHAITIIDPNSSPLRQSLDAFKIRRERRSTVSYENKRMRIISSRRSELNKLNDGLIPAIASFNWNLVEVLALRQEYEKKLSALPVDDVLDDKRRLELFDKVTEKFKQKHTKRSVTASLESARQSSANLDTLLLRIFDLTVAQKNRLLADFKEYRDLGEEESAITQARAQRKNKLQ